MEKEEFKRRLKEKDYENLEKDLLNEYKKTKDLQNKFYLGICYSEQLDKEDEAIKIFKELIKTDLKHPNMYSFLAKCSKSEIEQIKIIKEGLKYFKNDKLLNNQLLFYLEGDEKIELYNKIKEKELVDFYGYLSIMSFYYKNKEYEKCIEILEIVFSTNKYSDNLNLKFLKILVSFLAKVKISETDLNSYTVLDTDTFYGLIIKLIEICLEKNKQKQERLILELPYIIKNYSKNLEIINFFDYTSSKFDLENVFFELIKKIESKYTDENIINKLKIIKFIQKFSWNYKFSKDELKKYLKILKEESKNYGSENILVIIMNIYLYLEDYKNYFEYYMKCLNYNILEYDYIDFTKFKLDDLLFAVSYIKQNLIIYDLNKDNYQTVIKGLIRNLFSEKLYEEITILADNINYKKLNYLEFAFEIAFSLVERKRYEDAKKLYQEYIKKYPSNSSGLNNLGLIYEKSNKEEMALKYYNKALKIDKDNTTIINNIKRCKEKIEVKKKQEEISFKALEYLENESFWMIERIKNFYSNANSNQDIICSRKELASILKCSTLKSENVLEQMLKKGYIIKNNDYLYDTISNVYRKNVKVEKVIKKLEKENILIEKFTNCFDNFTIKSFKNLEYEKIITKLKTIKNQSIRDIFIRDYNELIFNYLSLKNKTVLLLSGSLIELSLIYILEINNIKKYKVGINKKIKKIDEMDITEMLEVCNLENILSKTPKNFIDGMKQFRNYIHPGRELREKNMEINKTLVDLSLNIVNWLILNLDFRK